MKHLRKNQWFLNKLKFEPIENEILSKIIVLVCLKHIYILFYVKKVNIEKIIYHILTIIS